MRRRLTMAALLLAAGSASAFEPEFVPGHVVTWTGGNATYRVNGSSFANAGLSSSVVTASFNAWSNDSLAVLNLTRGADVTGPAESDTASDGTNEVEFITSGWSDGAGVLGVTYVYFGQDDVIQEADMYINGQDFQWDDPTGAGCSSAYDLGATMTHEAGHFIGLGHSSESGATCNPASPSYDAVLCDATMYYAGGPCDTSGQSLECDDLAGLRYLYPPGGTRHADWVTQGFASVPAPGAITAGAPIAVTGTAFNKGSLRTSSGIAAVYVTSQSGSISGGVRLAPTSALGQVDTCRSTPVSLTNVQFPADQAGTRWLVVRLDDGTTTSEYDETTNNLASIGPFTVTVVGPVLVVSPLTLGFAAASGGAAPAAQSVSVTNGGSGSLSWSATDDRSWISLSRTSGTQGQGFDVQVDPTGLAAGHYDGSVTVTSSGATGSPEIVAVGLDVTAGPILSVAPTSLTFAATPSGSLPATQSLAISNTGAGTLSWTASDDQSWMSVAPGSGTNAGSVTVSITSTSLSAGTYTGHVTIGATGAQGSPQSIPITYTLTASPPALDVAPTSLTFSGPVGGILPPQSLAITNTGGGTLAFTASSNRPWISASPGSGSAPASVTVNVDASGLTAGSYSGAVTITSSGATGSPKTIPVSLTISNQPSLSLEPSSLGFAAAEGASPSAKTITVGNDGSGSLTYTISDDAAWLSLAPATGATLPQGGARQHQVSISSGSLAAGTYHATITVAAAAADDSPKTVDVTLEIGQRPPLVVAPPTLTFAATAAAPSPAPQAISVGTSGASSAAWSATSDVAWLTLTPSQGTGDGSISVRASATGLAAGTQSGHVTITSSALAASPQRVDVSFTVAAGPRLAAAPSSFRWSATRGAPLPSAQSLDVSNAGTGSLSWSISGAPSWLQVAPASGTGNATVTLTPTTTDLPPGRLAAALSVTASGAYDSPRTIDLTYDVVGPALAFTPERARLELSGGAFVGPSSASVVVGSLGGASSATWTAGVTAPWLTVSPSSGAVGATVSIGLVQPERLRPGVYDASVIFASTGAANSPAPVPVSVVVRQAPGLSIAPPSLALTAVLGGGVQAASALSLDEAGDRDGDWTIGAHPSWLVASPLLGRSGDRVAISVDASGLPAGTQSGTLEVLSGGEVRDVPVTLEVVSAPVVTASAAALGLVARTGETSASETVSIDNVGAASPGWTATASAPWIVATPTGGAFPALVGVSADASSLTPGQHRGTLTFAASSGRAASIDVTTSVAAAGVPVASVTQDLTSGCAPLSVTFGDASTGATSRAWRFDDGTTASTTPVVHEFASPGEHWAELTVTNASGSQTVRAPVIVRQPPLAFAGVDRRVAFEPDGETRITLEDARAVAAWPARIASLSWTASRGTFADTGLATSALERPELLVPSGRGGLDVTITLAVADDAGCTAGDSATIKIRADVDLDGDTWNELVDNCPGLSNSLQGDQDADGVGSTCDSCPGAFDPSAADADATGFGDACEPAPSPTVALASAIARACQGVGVVPASVTAQGRVRRVALKLAGRAPVGADAIGAALAAGGTGVVTASGAELRVPAGVALDGASLDVGIPITSADDVVAVPCAAASLGYAQSETAATCADGEVRLRPDGDLVPAGAPNGILDVGDVVRMLRVSVGLDDLSEAEAARADLAPGSSAAGSWAASPDCRIDVSDVVVALRAAVGLVTLPR